MKRRVSLAIVLCLVAGLVVPGLQGVSALATKSAAVTKSEGEAGSEAVVEAEFTDESESLTAAEADTEAIEAAETETESESETETEEETETESETETEIETETETEEDSIVGELVFAQCEDYINIRAESNTDSEVTAKIYNNCAATVLAVDGEWYEIASGNAQGYVMAEYFAIGDEAAAIAEEVGYNVARVQVEYLNIRAEESTDSEVIDVAKEGDEIEVVLYGEEWMKVALGDDVYGYICSEYVEYITYYPVAETLEEEQARLIEEGLLDAATLETDSDDETESTTQTETQAETTASVTTAQTEAVQTGTTTTSVTQTESTQAEAAQTEAAQTEATQTEATQTEASAQTETQTEAVQTEAAQTETSAQTETQTEAVQTEATVQTEASETEEVISEGDAYDDDDDDSEGYYDADTDTYYDGKGNVISTASSVSAEASQTEASQAEATQTEAIAAAETQQTETEAAVAAEAVQAEAPQAETPVESEDTYETEAAQTETAQTESATETGTTDSASASLGESIAEYALQFAGNPYVYGGTSLTDGADCSGFVQSVFANFGIYLSRTAAAQSTNGTVVSSGEVQPGDLFFYSSSGDGTIDHVAIYIGNGRIVHAANSTRGICTDSAYYTTPVCIVRCY